MIGGNPMPWVELLYHFQKLVSGVGAIIGGSLVIIAAIIQERGKRAEGYREFFRKKYTISGSISGEVKGLLDIVSYRNMEQVFREACANKKEKVPIFPVRGSYFIAYRASSSAIGC